MCGGGGAVCMPSNHMPQYQRRQAQTDMHRHRNTVKGRTNQLQPLDPPCLISTPAHTDTHITRRAQRCTLCRVLIDCMPGVGVRV